MISSAANVDDDNDMTKRRRRRRRRCCSRLESLYVNTDLNAIIDHKVIINVWHKTNTSLKIYDIPKSINTKEKVDNLIQLLEKYKNKTLEDITVEKYATTIVISFNIE